MITQQRLLVSGCSFTNYCWPTWADYLGATFQHYFNVGTAGYDNSCISRSIIDNAKANDLVIILWSGWNRHTMWDENGHFVYGQPNNKWIVNYERWSKNWLVNFYNPVERFINTMDFVRMVDLHSKVVGYDVYHFPAFPWFLGEIEKTVRPDIPEVYKKYDIKNNYLLEIDLETFYDNFKEKNNYPDTISNSYNQHDHHPSPLGNFNYLTEIISPKIGVDLSSFNFHVFDHEEKTLSGFGAEFTKRKEEILEVH